MNNHKNAPLTPEGRYRMVNRVLAGETMTTVAKDMHVSRQTVGKMGPAIQAGRCRRSSRSKFVTPSKPPRHAAIVNGPQDRADAPEASARSLHQRLKISPSSVSRYLRAAGLSKSSDLDPPPPVVRYERGLPGSRLFSRIGKKPTDSIRVAKASRILKRSFRGDLRLPSGRRIGDWQR